MKEVVRMLLQKEEASAIVEIRTTSFKDLTHIEARYLKDGMAFISKCYCTPAWIAPTPFGPGEAVHGTEPFICNALSDVSEITSYSSVAEMKKVPFQFSKQTRGLEMLFDRMNAAAIEFVSKALQPYEWLLRDSCFVYSPRPMVIATLADNDELYGSLAFGLDGSVDIITWCDKKLYGIVDMVKKDGVSLTPALIGGVGE